MSERRGGRLHRLRDGVASVTSALLLSGAAAAQQSTASDTSVEPLLEVVVTGSRIKRAQSEGPAPVTTITREQLEREGFTTAYEALQSLTQSTGGGLQGQFFANGPTANATTVDLRGLGPGRTLVLFNGRRAADYPLPFNGASNIVNLSAIPTAAIERIEVLSSGASAIYGSDAVAGVINFVMRDHFDDIEIRARGGRLTEGGGDSQRVQLTGGLGGDAFSAVYAFEYFKRDAIFADEQRRYDSLADDLSGEAPKAQGIAGLYSVLSGGFILADEQQCAQFGRNAHVYDARADGLSQLPGPMCGDPTAPAQHTIRNETENLSAFFNSRYDFGDGLQAFGTLSLWQSDSRNLPSTPVYILPGLNVAADVGPNAVGGFDLIAPLRSFELSETGREPTQKFDERAWDAVLGVRGTMFAATDWELSFHHADYTVERDNRLLLGSAANDFFLGPQLGTTSLGGFDLPIFAVPDYSRFLRPLTPAEFRSISAINHTEADSSNDQASAVVSGELWQMPAGAARFAAVLEWGTQEYQIDVDPREAAGQFAGLVTSFPGGGSRDRSAAGVELAMPLLEPLRLTLAGRYDRYDDVTDVDGAFTYNIGLEYRPFKPLLLRGSYATSFRAPDMHYVFAGASQQVAAPVDILRCRRDLGVTNLSQCGLDPTASVLSYRQGNRELQEEKGTSWTAGLAWTVTDSLDVSLDYFDIELENMVDDLTYDYIMRTEADCALGATLSGQPIDSNSALCQFIGGLTERALPVPGVSADNLVSVTSLPINRALQSVRGVDAALTYALDAHRYGKFSFALAWTHILKEERQEFAADPVEMYRDRADNHDLRSKIRSSLTWRKGGFSQTLFLDRQGSRPTLAARNSTLQASSARTKSYSIYNYTASYTSAGDAWSLGLILDNLFDADPRIDRTYSEWPFFYAQNVNPYGREVFVEAGYRFK
jgi:iron complex outermembrane recepter protein